MKIFHCHRRLDVKDFLTRYHGIIQGTLSGLLIGQIYVFLMNLTGMGWLSSITAVMFVMFEDWILNGQKSYRIDNF